MDTVTLPSGHELRLVVAPFAAANKLKKTLARELLAVGLDFASLNFSAEIRDDPRVLNTLKNLVCQLASSDAVEVAVMECAQQCRITVPGAEAPVKVSLQVFETEEMRGDFIHVMWEVIKLNMSLFLAGLDLSSLTSSGATTKSQS